MLRLQAPISAVEHHKNILKKGTKNSLKSAVIENKTQVLFCEAISRQKNACVMK